MDSWRIEEYTLHSRSSRFARHVQAAEACIAEALGTGARWYVAWSGGKDSTVLLHLVRQRVADIPIVHVSTPLDYPDCVAQVAKWIQEWGLHVAVLRPAVSPWDILDKHGGPEGQVNEAGSELDRQCFYEPIQSFVAQHGLNGVFLGLRKHESRARMMNRLTRGRLYQTRSGRWTATPLADWTVQDVFAYHVAFDIPWLPVYERTRGHPDPERIREGWFIPGVDAARHGGLVWLKANYPELHRELAKRYPAYAGRA